MNESLVVAVLLAATVVLAAAVAWWLVQLVAAVRTPTHVWEASGQSQLVHVLLMVFLGVIGAVVYAVVARPRLRRAQDISRPTQNP